MGLGLLARKSFSQLSVLSSLFHPLLHEEVGAFYGKIFS
jgi:hypothetical protein